jgi:hypothetical protein
MFPRGSHEEAEAFLKAAALKSEIAALKEEYTALQEQGKGGSDEIFLLGRTIVTTMRERDELLSRLED